MPTRVQCRPIVRKATYGIAPAVLFSVGLGCAIGPEPDRHSDSTRRVVVALDTMPPAAKLPADSANGAQLSTEPITSSETGVGASTDSTIPPSDSVERGGSTPSAAELALLSAELVMPLETVRPEELRDTYHEPRGGGTRVHEALDIMAPRGTPVHSAAAGRVLRLHTSEAGGLMVYAADSAERFILMYAHLDRYAAGLRDGLPLQRGQVIGYVGTTGNAPPGAPHLHFAIAYPKDVDLWWTGVPVDPRPLLQHRAIAP